jgi:hypothetical protein
MISLMRMICCCENVVIFYPFLMGFTSYFKFLEIPDLRKYYDFLEKWAFYWFVGKSDNVYNCVKCELIQHIIAQRLFQGTFYGISYESQHLKQRKMFCILIISYPNLCISSMRILWCNKKSEFMISPGRKIQKTLLFCGFSTLEARRIKTAHIIWECFGSFLFA